MEFRCPSCKEITENEFINRIYDEMKYQCLSCRKEWKIIFVENKSILSVQPENLYSQILENSFPDGMINGNVIANGFKFSKHEIYSDNKRAFCRRCGLSILSSERLNNNVFNDKPCVWPNEYANLKENK